jgi:hypothetical protein
MGRFGRVCLMAALALAVCAGGAQAAAAISTSGVTLTNQSCTYWGTHCYTASGSSSWYTDYGQWHADGTAMNQTETVTMKVQSKSSSGTWSTVGSANWQAKPWGYINVSTNRVEYFHYRYDPNTTTPAGSGSNYRTRYWYAWVWNPDGVLKSAYSHPPVR